MKEKIVKELKVPAIEEGTVIDHIPAKVTLKVVDILKLRDELVTIGINLKSKKLGKKGIVKIADKELSKKEFDRIALVAPKATINIIKNYKPVKKIQVEVPDIIEGILTCINPHCITRHQKIKTKFNVLNKAPLEVKCHYCETIIKENEIII